MVLIALGGIFQKKKIRYSIGFMVSTSLQDTKKETQWLSRFVLKSNQKIPIKQKQTIAWAKKKSSSNSLNAFVIIIWQKIRLILNI